MTLKKEIQEASYNVFPVNREARSPNSPSLSLTGENNSGLVTTTLKEFYDRKLLIYIIQNFDALKENIRSICFDDNYDPKAKCEGILKAISRDGYLTVRYDRSDGKPFGRMYAKGVGGLQNLPREIRHTLAKNLYYDIDMVNAHPVFLTCLAKSHGFSCTYLEKYIKNRESCIAKLIQLNPDMTRETVKNTVLALINGGSKDFNSIPNKSSWIINLKVEMETLLENIAKCYPAELEYRKKKKNSNFYASTVNYVLCDIEHRCLMVAVEFFKQHGYSVDVFVFDGCMIRKTDKPITEEILNAVSEYVYEKTSYPIKFTLKPMDEGLDIPSDYADTVEDYIPINNDLDAANILLDIYGEEFKVCNGRYFYKDRNIWVEDCSSTHTNIKNNLFTKAVSLNMVKIIKNKVITYSHNRKGATDISCMAFTQLPQDDSFINKLWNSNLKTLTFNNGVYSFKDKTFYPDGLPNVYTTIKINRDFKVPSEAAIKEVYDNLLHPILGTGEELDYFLKWSARGLAGEYEEKTWGIMMGQRNSGKGVLVLAFKNAFGDYINSFSAESWLCVSSFNGDEAMKQSWLVNHEFTRLNFSNEIRLTNQNNKKLSIDGTIPKKIASGGDVLKCRRLFKGEQSVRLQGRFMLMLNEITDINPDDAKETAIFFDIKSIFKQELTPDDERINKEGTYRVIKANDKIKSIWLNRDDILDAFTYIVINSYTPEIPVIPNGLKQECDEFKNEESFSAKLKEFVTITCNESDRVRISDLNNIRMLLKISSKKLKQELVLLGAVYDNKHSIYKKIKLIE